MELAHELVLLCSLTVVYRLDCAAALRFGLKVFVRFSTVAQVSLLQLD